MNNIRYTILLFLLSFGLVSQAQYFSGELTYSLKIIPKQTNINVDSIMNEQPGTAFTYLIKEYFYKSTYFKDGKQTYSYTYHDQSKRMYDEEMSNDYITFRDSRKGNTSRIRSIIYKDSIKVIAGYPCFMVERVYESYISKTYYAKDLKINPEAYKGHEVGDWYNQIKEVGGSLSLGSISEYSTHVEEHLVTKVEQRKVKDEEFDIPKKMVVASFTALDTNVALDKPSEESLQCFREKIKGGTNIPADGLRIYVGFIVDENGKVSHIKSFEKHENGLDAIAESIIKDCGLQFAPGKIADKHVSALVYFPIDFTQ